MSDRRIYSYIPLHEQPGLWGAYAQYMYLHPNSIVHPMDASIPASTAVMFNPLGAGFRWAVELPKTSPGDRIVILGPGQRGLASVIAAKEAGASQIIVTGLEADRDKLALARSFGADHTIDVENENAVRRVKGAHQQGAPTSSSTSVPSPPSPCVTRSTWCGPVGASCLRASKA